MPSGGARARSGPPPDPNAIRRTRPSDQAGWTHLSGPRSGDPPPWPLSRFSAREKVLWATEWTTRPQAVLWEHNGWELEVALYVRAIVAAERVKASADSRRLVRQFMEGLGISADGLRRNRWIIVSDAPAAAPTETDPEAPVSIDKARFARVVSDAI